ncbi:NTPase DNA primase [Eastern grey kangaroopox virus]|uniref:NTPase DNA primase n=1 Tax=Eastern grey kangaroopox virus TaxID=2042482 RepID=A0A2C9DT59_9POXV|nr:NTPase DNA primase [Eastern grey kangaroopox virus]ATI21192.1 NTPase DNA primase [Eastern grey kangaroopox virus]ATX75098.1 NTPase, DNA primase [Eastern grey kangaroopox virus]
MAHSEAENNHIIFVLKRLGVPSECRDRCDRRYAESFTCEELDRYIREHPDCTLFETLRDEEMYSTVRVFLDVDLSEALPPQTLVPAFRMFMLCICHFLADFALGECELAREVTRSRMIRDLQSDFSMTESTNSAKTSFHLVFLNLYTDVETLIRMKRPLAEVVRRSTNPLVRAIDTAVYRHKPSLRVVGTRKSPECRFVHRRTRPHADLADYLFTFVNFGARSQRMISRERWASPDVLNWDSAHISFSDAMRKVCHAVGNEILNLDEIDESNFTDTPLIVSYSHPCALCRKRAHKHPHHMVVSNDSIRIFKSGNPNSCRVKTIQLEGNRLFTISQKIMDANVINLSERGDYIVWLRNSWRLSEDCSNITKLVLHMRDDLNSEYNNSLLCPRNRKVIENNLRDMLVDPVETDIFPEKLQFLDGVYDIADSEFYSGLEAKDFMCTVSTGYRAAPGRDADAAEMEAAAEAELAGILDDIQPRTAENADNRELYEQVLSSCLCGTTKPCIFFFFGETATGKSTTKKLLRSVMHNMFLETGQVILTEPMDKGPNPFIANMHLKRVVFCSELPDFSCAGARKLRSDNVKKLTEPCLVGRPCYSNKINNRNHATIIIDTNYRPVFDKVDNAIMRRIGLVHFKTHFSNSRRAVASRQYDFVKPLDESLDRKIEANRFRFAFLRILLGWYQKYHVPHLVLRATPEQIPDFKFRLSLDSLIVPSNSTHTQLFDALSRLGYVLTDEDLLALPAAVFQQRLAGHFNVRVHGYDIESFVTRNKKYLNLNEEYLEYIFIEDIPPK